MRKFMGQVGINQQAVSCLRYDRALYFLGTSMKYGVQQG